jgi:hypothetical protein
LFTDLSASSRNFDEEHEIFSAKKLAAINESANVSRFLEKKT